MQREQLDEACLEPSRGEGCTVYRCTLENKLTAHDTRRARGIKKECLKFIEKSDDLNVDMLTSSELACMKVNQQPFVP